MPEDAASEAFNRLLATQLSTLNRDDLAAAMRSARVVRGWLDGVDIMCARRARELAVLDGADSAEGMLIDNGRRSGREARATGQRADICNQVPEMEAALTAGDVSTDHLDALARAAENLDDAARADLFAMGAMLAAEASEAHVDSFSRTCRDLASFVHHQHHPGDDSAELDRQRAASKISRWVDQITGMHNTTISLDPLRDAQLWQLLDAEIARHKQRDGNSKTPFSLLQVEALFAALNRRHGNVSESAAPENSPPEAGRSAPGSGSGAHEVHPSSNGHVPATACTAASTSDPAHSASGVIGSTESESTSGPSEAGSRAGDEPGSACDAQDAHPSGDPQPLATLGTATPPSDAAHSESGVIGSTESTATSGSSEAGSGAGDEPGSACDAQDAHPPGDPQPTATAAPPTAEHAPATAGPTAGAGEAVSTRGTDSGSGGPGIVGTSRPSLEDTRENGSGNEPRQTSNPSDIGTRLPAVPDVYVHIDLTTLLTGPHAGTISELSSGVPVPVSTIRRMCCDANIIPVVFNGKGELLDVGREHRTATRAQRRALRALYRTCGHPHCTVSFDNCRIHHIHWWEHGGTTDLRNLMPLCEAHHHQVHEGGWNITMAPNRHATWHHPTGAQHQSKPDRRPSHLPAAATPSVAAAKAQTAITESYQPMLC